MCFFDQHRFACGDWKWGYFRQHCNREYRNGEACDMKLVMQTYGIEQKCKICEKIDSKRRRLGREQDRLRRWAREGNKYSAPIEKVQQAIATLDTEIYELVCERQKNSGATRGMEEPETDLEGKSQSLADLQTTNSSTGTRTIRAERRWQVITPEDKLHFRGQMSDSEKARFILKSTSSTRESETSQRDLPKKNGLWDLAQGNPHKFVGSSSTLVGPNLDPVTADSVEKNGLTPAQNIRKAQNRAASRTYREQKELDIKRHGQNSRVPEYVNSSEPAPASSNASRFIFNPPMPQAMGGSRDADPRHIPSNYIFANTYADDYVGDSYINKNDQNRLRAPTLLNSMRPSQSVSPLKGKNQQPSALCSAVTPKLFVTATISQDCTRENYSSLLMALKERPRGLKIKSSGIEEGDRKRIRLR